MEDWRTVIEKLIENQEAIISKLGDRGITVQKRTIGNIDELFEKKSSWW